MTHFGKFSVALEGASIVPEVYNVVGSSEELRLWLVKILNRIKFL